MSGMSGELRASPGCASLKAKEVNWRAGPGHEHAVLWIYKSPRWPVVIEKKYEHWYYVQDWLGTKGWVHGPMLSFRPTVLVTLDMVALHKKPCPSSRVLAYLKKGVLGGVQKRDKAWVYITLFEHNIRGWVHQKVLWPTLPEQ
jgi:SH3-like domain-containing protein